jgi:hypothetical protein
LVPTTNKKIIIFVCALSISSFFNICI